MSTVVNVNGTITSGTTAMIPVFDHGFLYGEGVYETLRTYWGRPFLFKRHMQRLRTSAGMLHLGVPFTDQELLQRVRDTMAEAALGVDADGTVREAYIRILLTRGVGELTYDPAATPVPSLVVIVKPLPVTPPEQYEHGVSVVLVDLIRNHPQSVNPRIKSNNLLNNAMGMQQALRRGAAEAVFRNYRGELSECAQSNLFIVTQGRVRTPPLEAGLLPGITRGCVIKVGADIGVSVEEATLVDRDLLDADEAFFTSTTKELMPIVRVDEHPIGTGRPGPITQQLLEAFHACVERWFSSGS
jgi:branched-chain amino acid aminotransferase